MQGEIQEIIDVCKVLHEKGYLAAADGNISCRLDEDKILITPTQKNKRYLKKHEIALMTMSGDVVSGQPSSEYGLHLSLYERVMNARCVIHAHPPIPIAWTVARPDDRELPIEAISELILGLGKVPIVPYARPGSHELAETVGDACSKAHVAIMARHGIVSWGETLTEALNGIDRVEHAATVLKAAMEIGGITSLPAEEVEALYAMRAANNSGAL